MSSAISSKLWYAFDSTWAAIEVLAESAAEGAVRLLRLLTGWLDWMSRERMDELTGYALHHLSVVCQAGAGPVGALRLECLEQVVYNIVDAVPP